MNDLRILENSLFEKHMMTKFILNYLKDQI